MGRTRDAAATLPTPATVPHGQRNSGPEIELRQLEEYLFEIPRSGNMRVPGHVYATAELMPDIRSDMSLRQVANVAELPGIVMASLAMPDIHWGYGFPIGGVAATDPALGGVISPGGVGYDINCGVRVLRTNLHRPDVESRMKELVDALFHAVPTGVGAAHAIRDLAPDELHEVLVRGAEYVIEDRGMGSRRDLEHTEEGGRLEGADPSFVSQLAMRRGARQMGTLGSGNHFLEIGVADRIFRPGVATALGIEHDTVCVLIHCGSRGFGHQVCSDYLSVMRAAVRKYGIALPDPQLCCAPLDSEEGRAYLGAMKCAANYAWANRQTITHLTRQTFERVFELGPADLGMELIYDVCHNIAKFEDHEVDGATKRLCVHRKGATRAFPPGHPQVPASLRDVGQPVLVPGDMGRYLYVLIGAPGSLRRTFGSTCHGAGRRMSRTRSKKESRGRDLVRELTDQGVIVRARGWRTIAEEMPHAYKDVAEVVDVMEMADISHKVCRLRPLGVIKG